MNCWEYMKCGRHFGGDKAMELGVCPACKESRLHGVHGGRNAGRACWVVAGTYCGDEVQGSFADKEKGCLSCSFYKHVRDKEKMSGNFRMSCVLARMINT